MKTIKQIITVVALVIFMLGSFGGNAQNSANGFKSSNSLSNQNSEGVGEKTKLICYTVSW